MPSKAPSCHAIQPGSVYGFPGCPGTCYLRTRRLRVYASLVQLTFSESTLFSQRMISDGRLSACCLLYLLTCSFMFMSRAWALPPMGGILHFSCVLVTQLRLINCREIKVMRPYCILGRLY